MTIHPGETAASIGWSGVAVGGSSPPRGGNHGRALYASCLPIKKRHPGSRCIQDRISIGRRMKRRDNAVGLMADDVLPSYSTPPLWNMPRHTRLPVHSAMGPVSSDSVSTPAGRDWRGAGSRLVGILYAWLCRRRAHLIVQSSLVLSCAAVAPAQLCRAAFDTTTGARVCLQPWKGAYHRAVWTDNSGCAFLADRRAVQDLTAELPTLPSAHSTTGIPAASYLSP